MGKYKKCPRCELNYILSEEDYCDVCKVELGLAASSSLLDDSLEDEDAVVLCPVCKVNTMGVDDEMCSNCKAIKEERDQVEDDTSWQEFLADDADEMPFEDGDIPLEELDEEDNDDLIEDEEEYNEPDDFDDEYFDGDDIEDDGDDEDDDEDF